MASSCDHTRAQRSALYDERGRQPSASRVHDHKLIHDLEPPSRVPGGANTVASGVAHVARSRLQLKPWGRRSLDTTWASPGFGCSAPAASMSAKADALLAAVGKLFASESGGRLAYGKLDGRFAGFVGRSIRHQSSRCSLHGLPCGAAVIRLSRAAGLLRISRTPCTTTRRPLRPAKGRRAIAAVGGSVASVVALLRTLNPARMAAHSKKGHVVACAVVKQMHQLVKRSRAGRSNNHMPAGRTRGQPPTCSYTSCMIGIKYCRGGLMAHSCHSQDRTRWPSHGFMGSGFHLPASGRWEKSGGAASDVRISARGVSRQVGGNQGAELRKPAPSSSIARGTRSSRRKQQGHHVYGSSTVRHPPAYIVGSVWFWGTAGCGSRRQRRAVGRARHALREAPSGCQAAARLKCRASTEHTHVYAKDPIIALL